MARPLVLRLALGLAAVGLAVAASGCDEAIDARPEIEQAYTLWGAFDPTRAEQAVRVVRIADTVRAGSGEVLDVEVLSVDLDTGEATSWRDSLVTYRDGSQGRVYRSELQPAFGSRHEFRVVPREGPPVTVYVPVPPLVEPLVAPGEGYPGDVRFRVAWPRAPQLNEIRLTYEVAIGNGAVERITVPFPGEAQESGDGWTLVLRLEQDSARLRDQIRRRPAYENGLLPVFYLYGLEIDVDVASETWRIPEVVRNDEVLRIQPEAFTNVENGYGFVGASYRASVRWEPTANDLRRTRTFEFPPSRAAARL